MPAALGTILLLVTGCSVGPKYVRPPVPSPPAYKEIPQAAAKESEIWRATQPKDGTNRGNWWEVFNDPQLNELEEKASSSSQEIAAAADNFLAARALVREARSQYFPTVTTNPSILNSRPSPGQFGGLQAGSSSGAGLTVKSYTDYSLPFDASWEPDFWGRIRSTVRANIYAAQASAADLENVRLSVQAELAVDYYELRAQDSLKELFDSTVTAYQDALNLTRDQYKAGLGNDEAVAQAEAQLKSAQAQDTNLGILRAQYEHAIAVLIGQPASSFSLPRECFGGKSSCNPGRNSLRASREAPGHCGGGAFRRSGERGNWGGQSCLFSDNPAQRLRGIRNFLGRELAYLAKPVLVGGPKPCRNHF